MTTNELSCCSDPDHYHTHDEELGDRMYCANCDAAWSMPTYERLLDEEAAEEQAEDEFFTYGREEFSPKFRYEGRERNADDDEESQSWYGAEYR